MIGHACTRFILQQFNLPDQLKFLLSTSPFFWVCIQMIWSHLQEIFEKRKDIHYGKFFLLLFVVAGSTTTSFKRIDKYRYSEEINIIITGGGKSRPILTSVYRFWASQLWEPKLGKKSQPTKKTLKTGLNSVKECSKHPSSPPAPKEKNRNVWQPLFKSILLD